MGPPPADDRRPTAAADYRGLALGSPGRGLQEGPDRARRLGDIGEQLGQRLTQRQGLPALPLGGEHVVDEGAALQNALLLTLQRLDLWERRGA